MTTKKQVVIVGAGMAGLTAAAYLARYNHKLWIGVTRKAAYSHG
ncbi:MAG TPA: FAD-dependent oxidoreductase [Patescibacteria group bacterium]|nr:FAD-dependent oxidoreductase [Patescibacteria group bacterium]